MSIISSSTTSTTAYKVTADTTGTLVLQTGSTPTTAVTIDTAQNMGLGVTPSTWSGGFKAFQYGATGAIAFQNNNWWIGNNWVYNSGDKYIASDYATLYSQQSGQHQWYRAASGTAGNSISFTQAMTLDSSGNLLVGRTSALGSERFNATGGGTDWVGYFYSNNSTQYYGVRVNTAVAQNNTSSLIYDGIDGGTLRFRVYANGGIANYSANNSNLSDSREKKDVELAGNYLSKICSIPVKTFLYNDQTDTDKNLGVIAQDVQSVAPELVAETNWGSEEEPKMRLSIYQTDLQYALMKCIQEQQAIIETLTNRISALENK
jgi:hypothetical protein